MRLCSAKHHTSRRLNGDNVAKSVDSSSAAVTRKPPDLAATTTRAATCRSFDAASSRTYNVDGGLSTPSSLSTPRTYVVDVLTETDDESSRQTSPRIVDRLARRCRRRRPQSLDNGQYSQLPVSTLTKDGGPEVEYSSHQSTSTETFVYSKVVSLSSESLRRRRRRPAITSLSGAAGVVSSTPNLSELLRPSPRRRSSDSSEEEFVMPSRAEPAEVQFPSREDADDAVTKSGVSDHRRVSRLPRLVTRPQDMLPCTSSVSATLLRAPRPRSFRYSRLHRRAVSALVPPPLRDMPRRWAWKANIDIN